MLQYMLDSHPDIFMYGEQFGGDRTSHSPRDIYLNMNYNSPSEYMDQYVFASKDGFRAIGFKLMYGHLTNVKKIDFRHYLQNRKIKIIHLVRRNMLDVALSSVLAKNTNKWVASEFTDPIYLNYECCKSTFKNYAESINAVDELGGHKVYYSELRDYSAHIGMLDYLGLRRMQLKISTTKQRVKSKREMILNYDDLRDRFSSTEYSKYFEEGS